jgi:hypothetical protein
MADLARFLARRRPQSTHTDYIDHRVPQGPNWVCNAAKAARVASHARLVQQLRFYRHWYVPDGGKWRHISRKVAAKNLVGHRNQEFLLSDAPLPPSIMAHWPSESAEAVTDSQARTM